MPNSHTRKALFHLKKFVTFPAPRLHPLLKPQRPHRPFSLNFTTVSDPHSFTISYLVTHCGFSPESALSASRKVHFDNPQKPDSVLAFFTARGFSPSQIRNIVKRERRIILCDPDKVLLPKFEFLRSKGASPAEIVHMVSTGPRFLSRSLDNHIVPAYEFVRGFLESDKQIIACLNRNSCFFSDSRLELNAKMLLDNGVKRSSIAKLLRMWPSVLCSCNLSETVRELKEMGFDSSTTTFSVALLAKRTVNKAKWGEKVETFRKWEWSEEDVLAAFKRQPYCMLTSTEKIDAVFSFWVNELGGSSSELVKSPVVFQLSLQRRMIPRASVLRFLASEGLRKKGARTVTAFLMTEKLFLDKFVKRFEKDSSRLLKMYEESMNVGSNGEKKNATPACSLVLSFP
ncbi:Mitochodrial transcription termination factor-related [Spatholobus suberectus]|nr:Mitochodrial transcription termination factor-related [Spatholobus suberectus]